MRCAARDAKREPARHDRFRRAGGDGKAEYILSNGVAAIAHGSARLTQDLAIVYRRTFVSLSAAADPGQGRGGKAERS